MRHLHVISLCLAGFVASSASAASDADFVRTAASGGMLEVELGRHASQHAASPSVRAFGQRMASDHGSVNQELKRVALQEGIAVPSGMSDEHREMFAKLSKLRGPEFDQAYMEMMVDDHEKDVAAFREQADEPRSEVDRFAAKTLPTLEVHLQEARTVQQSLGERASGSPAKADRRPEPVGTERPARP